MSFLGAVNPLKILKSGKSPTRALSSFAREPQKAPPSILTGGARAKQARRVLAGGLEDVPQSVVGKSLGIGLSA